MRKALVIVDMQYGFINNITEHLVNRICDFVDKNREHFDLVIATQYVNNENTPCYLFEGWKDCMEGTEEANIVDNIISRADHTFKKDVYSCWGNELVDTIKEHHIDKVYFVGVNTGCCVLHSAFDAYNSLQDCAVIEDLCGSTSGDESHKAAIKVLKECITKQRVITVEQFIKEEM